MNSDYFVEEGQIVGECDQLISEAEINWRDVSVFEMHPYRRVARFCRNNQFTSESTRTPQALQKALSYLHSTLFPLLAQPHPPQLCPFLAETLKAVRCELFVQGIVWPQVQLLIFRLQTVLEVVSGQTSKMETSAVCLESLISGKNKETMSKKYVPEYREALRYSILLAKEMDLQRLLTIHETAMDDPLLTSTIRFRIRCNYSSYFSALREEDQIIKCILWKNLSQEMNQAAAVIAKAYRQVSRQMAMEIGVELQDQYIEAKNVPALASASKGQILSKWWHDVYVYNRMHLSRNEFKEALLELRKHFNTPELQVEAVAILLQPYIHLSPQAISSSLLRCLGKTMMNWDDLLQYLAEELDLHQSMKRQKHSRVSAIELHQVDATQFNPIQQHLLRPNSKIETVSVLTENMTTTTAGPWIAVGFQKSLLLYDTDTQTETGLIQFKYSEVKQKALNKWRNKNITQNGTQNGSQNGIDIVRASVERNVEPSVPNKEQAGTPKGDGLDSAISLKIKSTRSKNESRFGYEPLKRTTTEGGRNVKLKSDEVKRIFTLFKDANLQDSIQISQAFSEARNTFSKHVVIDRTILEREKITSIANLSSLAPRRNFFLDVAAMRTAGRKLTQNKVRRTNSGIVPETEMRGTPISGFRREEWGKNDPLQEKCLQIVSLSFCEFHILVALYNHEIRLYRLKRTLDRFREQCIWEICQETMPNYVLLYRSTSRRLFNTVHCLLSSLCSTLIVSTLGPSMEIQEQLYSIELGYTPIFTTGLPLAAYSELGHLSLIEVNSVLSTNCSGDTVELHNPESRMRVNISKVVQDTLSVIVGCKDGYVYLYDKNRKLIKLSRKVSSSAILEMALTAYKEELVVVLQCGNLLVCDPASLITHYTLNNYKPLPPCHLLMLSPTECVLVYHKTLQVYSISTNDEKAFNITKPKKIYLTRRKLIAKFQGARAPDTPHQPDLSLIRKVVEVVERKCIIFILQKGEISLYDYDLSYLGSFHYQHVAKITDVTCDLSYQFISLLLDDNHILAVNLYTQATIFLLNTHSPQFHPVLMNFFQAHSVFFAVLDSQYMVRQYSYKGELVNQVNLTSILAGMQPIRSPFYVANELHIPTKSGWMIVLQKNTYERKVVIKICEEEIVMAKKGSALSVKGVYKVEKGGVFLWATGQDVVFNGSMMIQKKQEGLIIHSEDRNVVELQNVQNYWILAIEKIVVIINRLTSTLTAYSHEGLPLQQFVL